MEKITMEQNMKKTAGEEVFSSQIGAHGSRLPEEKYYADDPFLARQIKLLI